MFEAIAATLVLGAAILLALIIVGALFVTFILAIVESITSYMRYQDEMKEIDAENAHYMRGDQ